MCLITPNESLALRWAELCADSSWDNIPGKIELNRFGVIELTPSTNRHGIRQAAVSNSLAKNLPHGTGFINCCLFTTDGVRVPDVAWASAEFMARHGESSPFPQAPEICVEVRSASNTDAEMEHKTKLFLEAGAMEVWIVSEAGDLQVFDSHGVQPASRFGVLLPPRTPAPPAV